MAKGNFSMYKDKHALKATQRVAFAFVHSAVQITEPARTLEETNA